MKALIKEKSNNKLRYIYVNIDIGNYEFTKIKIIFDNELGWVVKPYLFGPDVLTSIELREIAHKLDEYNKTPKKWKQQMNSKNL